MPACYFRPGICMKDLICGTFSLCTAWNIGKCNLSHPFACYMPVSKRRLRMMTNEVVLESHLVMKKAFRKKPIQSNNKAKEKVFRNS